MAAGRFSIERVPQTRSFYVGRDSEERAALLIACAAGSLWASPLQLAGIEARFGTRCSILDASGEERFETLSTIVCLSRDDEIEGYFCSIAESLLAALGDQPTVGRTVEAVGALVEIFQKLRVPGRRALAGLLGELCMIYQSRDPAGTIAAWRADDEERFDFVVGEVRMDVKAATNRTRVHSVSLEQANPVREAIGIIASIWIEMTGGGMTLEELLGRIEERIASAADSMLKLRKVVAESLGASAPTAMKSKFDVLLACSSVRLFDSGAIPAIRPPLPQGVSAVRFSSDLSLADALAIEELEQRLSPEARVLLPEGKRAGPAVS